MNLKFCHFFQIFILAGFAGSATAATIENGLTANTCLEAPSGATSGKQLQLNICNGTEKQQFVVQYDGQIRFGALCVDAQSGMGGNGDAIVLSSCHSFDNQLWTRTSEGEIRGIKGKCMDVSGSRVILWTCRGVTAQKWTVKDIRPVSVPANDCAVMQVHPSPQLGLTVWSPDGKQYLVNKEDANGIAQVYVGKRDTSIPVCITCTDKVNGPKAKKLKMQPRWHPSGRWIVLAVEQENFSKPWFSTPEMIEGWLQSGLWVDIYATTPDGATWFRLQDFGPSNKADGFTGVAFTPDGRKGVWAQIVDGNIFAYGFGKWELIVADFQEVNGVPSFTNLRNITPPSTYWLEPGNFSPNGKDLVITADYGFTDHSKVEGQDQYILNIDSGKITNLTKSPNIWDEHGVFSPDGEKIIFMSSYPYRADPKASTIWGLKTEFMMIDKDGSNLRQISHFNDPGHVEYSYKGSVAANGEWSLDGKSFSAISLFFPKYKSWEINFEGSCGGTERP